MPVTPRRQAWLLMAAGDNRDHGGNAGYDDQPDVYYSWDDTVSNHRNIKVGDVVAIWDKERLLGLSVVEAIETKTAEKILFRCPGLNCGRAGIKKRIHRLPRFRCEKCGLEFDEPATKFVTVTEYRSRHDAAWTSLVSKLDGSELRSLCESPRSQLSMRSLDWPAFRAALEAAGVGRAVSRVTSRSPDFAFFSDEDSQRAIPRQAEHLVRVRYGRPRLREKLIGLYGQQCAFTGAAPQRALQAGQLFSYGGLGEKHQHGGLLLRRDVHRLLDDGSLAVDPRSLTVDVSPLLGSFPQYERLHGAPLALRLRNEQREWLEKHWAEHRW